MKCTTVVIAIVLGAASAASADELQALTREAESLKGGAEVWTHLPWRECLLDASRESRETGKPLFIYAIAGDPTGRC